MPENTLVSVGVGLQIDLFSHDTCRHKHFRMTCEQYDELLVEADNRCQVCRLHGWQNDKNILFIDHDADHGDWAVRGLLCNSCNTTLGKDRDKPRDEAFAAYLDSAWYVRMLAARGFAPVLPEEPPIGSVVDFGGRQPQRTRAAQGWVRVINGYPWHPVTWRGLYRSYGPHRMKVVRMGDGKPLKQLSRYSNARRY